MRLTAAFIALLFAWVGPTHATTPHVPQVTITAAGSVMPVKMTGRLFLMISHRLEGEPRLVAPATFAYYFNDPSVPYAALFAQDVNDWGAGRPVVMGDHAVGYPYRTLQELPDGEYSIQAVFNVYTKFTRSDGRTIYAHADHGDGQQFQISPGNLTSEPQIVRLARSRNLHLHLTLSRVIPPIAAPADTKFVRRFSFKSELVSRFWGADMNFGAIVVLPKGYDEHPDAHYPVVFHMGHFEEGIPLAFSEEDPTPPPADAPASVLKEFKASKAFHDGWISGAMPRVILVSLQHPTPFYDDSYLINSPNNGPWEDAFFKEMLPALEAKFRIIPHAYARVMVGGSTGAWISAALQVRHPDQFGGAWIFAPDPVDFREFCNIDLYSDRSAFQPDGYEWMTPERYLARSVKGEPRVRWRDMSRVSTVLGSHGRSGEFLDSWSAIFGPVGADGYPQEIWNHETGEIDHQVAEYWRGQGFDLRDYLERHWSTIGPSLVGKLHFAVGDMDNFYLNNAVYRMQEFLESGTTKPPYGGSFKYGRPQIGHQWFGYDPWPMALLSEMAEQIRKNAPPDSHLEQWQYP